jgi:hypothetical protein
MLSIEQSAAALIRYRRMMSSITAMQGSPNVTLDGNEAGAAVAHRTCEVIATCPITAASMKIPMDI